MTEILRNLHHMPPNFGKPPPHASKSPLCTDLPGHLPEEVTPPRAFLAVLVTEDCVTHRGGGHVLLTNPGTELLTLLLLSVLLLRQAYLLRQGTPQMISESTS